MIEIQFQPWRVCFKPSESLSFINRELFKGRNFRFSQNFVGSDLRFQWFDNLANWLKVLVYGGDETRPLVRLLCCALVGFTRRYEEFTWEMGEIIYWSNERMKRKSSKFPNMFFFCDSSGVLNNSRGVSCAWVNVFFFVDSPYKRRAARKITFWWLGWFEVLGMNRITDGSLFRTPKNPQSQYIIMFFVGNFLS